MSSFRPDTESLAPSFIPMGFAAISRGARAQAKEAERFVSMQPSAVASGSRSTSAGDVDGERNPADLRPDQTKASTASTASKVSQEDLDALAAFEQAAFERGVESAQTRADGLTHACDAFDAAVRHLERAATTSVGANRELVLSLASEMAAHWLGAELSIAPERLGAVLDRAIEACGDSSELRVALHPEDLALVKEGQAERVAGWQASRKVVLVADRGLARGEFELQAGAQTVDGRQEAILASLRDALSVALDVPPPSDEESSS